MLDHTGEDDRYPIEYIGIAFENLYGQTPEIKEPSNSRLRSRRHRRDQGVFFTPKAITKYMVENTLEPLIGDSNDPCDILELKIVDPACGAGFFLLDALRLLAKKLSVLQDKDTQLSKRNAFRLVAENCLYGVDINPLTVEIAQALIWLEVRDPSLPINFLNRRIKVGDSLLGFSPEAFLGLEDVNIHFEQKNKILFQTHYDFTAQLLDNRFKSFDLGNLKIQPFSWELHFPEVFYTKSGDRKNNSGFDAVISNPPWGKIKPGLKEFYIHIDRQVSGYQGIALRNYVSNGINDIMTSGKESWDDYVKEKRGYAQLLRDSGIFNYQKVKVNGNTTGGDADLYKYFMERAYQLTHKKGRIGLVIPGSFYHTQGATGIRTLYFNNGEFEVFFSFENKKKIFPIHGMFKYLLVVYQKGSLHRGVRRSGFGLTSIEQAIRIQGSKNKSELDFSFQFLKKISGKLITVPEINSNSEKELIKKFHSLYPTLGDQQPSLWNVSFVRELDMTNDSKTFKTKDELIHIGCTQLRNGIWKSPNGKFFYPLFEGRMVHQYDYAAKMYIKGSGRIAKWTPLTLEEKAIVPHYYVSESDYSSNIERIGKPRAGFCDVTGQANERTVLASIIPARYPCGNKVPTCTFNVDDIRIHLIWIAIANSFVVDWIIRRIMSTTLNFFHWKQIPFPRIDPTSDIGQELIPLSAKLSFIEPSTRDQLNQILNDYGVNTGLPDKPFSYQDRANFRATIDALIADIYSLTPEEYSLILSDFPLLDRNQQPIPLDEDNLNKENVVFEKKSTITRDLALLSYFERRNLPLQSISNLIPNSEQIGPESLQTRVHLAEMVGACAYVPSEHVLSR